MSVSIIQHQPIIRLNVDRNICYEEFDYTPEEEAEVDKELMLGLMLGEIKNTLTRKELKEWWTRRTVGKGDYLGNITTADLIEISGRRGIMIK